MEMDNFIDKMKGFNSGNRSADESTKVFVVLVDHGRNNDEVIGVFNTEPLAKRCVQSHKERFTDCYAPYHIEKWSVNEGMKHYNEYI
jgi:hypothetical protein